MSYNNNLSLKVDVDAGADITNVCYEAVDLANRIGIDVEFKFNGTTCIAKPKSSPQELIGLWYIEMSKDKQYRIAIAQPRGSSETT